MIQAGSVKEPGFFQMNANKGYNKPDGYTQGEFLDHAGSTKPSYSGIGQQQHHWRECQAVIQPALNIQQPLDAFGNSLETKYRRYKDRVGGTQGRAKEERMCPVQSSHVMGQNRDTGNSERHPD